jgi:hypothetical protein
MSFGNETTDIRCTLSISNIDGSVIEKRDRLLSLGEGLFEIAKTCIPWWYGKSVVRSMGTRYSGMPIMQYFNTRKMHRIYDFCRLYLWFNVSNINILHLCCCRCSVKNFYFSFLFFCFSFRLLPVAANKATDLIWSYVVAAGCTMRWTGWVTWSYEIRCWSFPPLLTLWL